MALDFLNRIKDFFKYQPVDTTRIKDPVPFVHTFGYEKSYGKPHPQDFERFIAGYKSWAYACAWKNATSVAKCKLCLYKKSINEEGDEELDKIGQHPFLDVINSVN